MVNHNYQHESSGCGLVGIISTTGKKMSGEQVLRAVAILHERGNGLGGGFAAYGIYPKYRDFFAFHLLMDSAESKSAVEAYLQERFLVEHGEAIPTRDPSERYPNYSAGRNLEEILPEITPSLLWRYFCKPRRPESSTDGLTDEDYVVQAVMHINENIDGAFVISSGRNMGVFKGVGYPEDLGHFFKLEEYEAYIWTGHARFPTNSQGWWGGAHPFTLLDWAVIHNGEISSYGINKRYLEMYGYKCTLMTDTEVVTYLLDLLIRKHGLPTEVALRAVAAPFWKDVDRMPADERQLHEALRMVYGSALLKGPFAIIFTHSRGMVGMNDRIKLRPLVAACKGDMVYMSSEECGIREICPNPERVWNPRAGHPVIARLEDGVK